MQRPVSISTVPEYSAIKRSLQTLQVDDFKTVRAGDVTQFYLRRGIASANVRYDAGKKARERLLLYSVGFAVPSSTKLAADRAFLDEIYATLRRDVPGLPPASQVIEHEVNLSKR